MRHDEATSPVSVRINVLRLPQKGMPVKIKADEKQRAALAGEHDLISVEDFYADLMVTSWKRNGVKVAGRVTATIVQACAVTLEPLENRIDEEFSAVFLPEDSKLGRLGFETGGEILIDIDGPDSPETFSGDSVDVGALAEEFFGLAIDPYARKGDAALPAVDVKADTPEVEGELQRKLRTLMQKS